MNERVELGGLVCLPLQHYDVFTGLCNMTEKAWKRAAIKLLPA